MGGRKQISFLASSCRDCRRKREERSLGKGRRRRKFEILGREISGAACAPAMHHARLAILTWAAVACIQSASALVRVASCPSLLAEPSHDYAGRALGASLRPSQCAAYAVRFWARRSALASRPSNALSILRGGSDTNLMPSNDKLFVVPEVRGYVFSSACCESPAHLGLDLLCEFRFAFLRINSAHAGSARW